MWMSGTEGWCMRYRFVPFAFLALLVLSCKTSPRMNSAEMLADMDPIELKSLSLGVSKALMSGTKGSEALAVLYPREGTVALEFSFSANKNQLMFDRKARDGFVSALAEYLKLYEARGLDRKQKAKKAVWGTYTVAHRWGIMTMNGEAYPKVAYSYAFDDKSPYFTIYIPRMPNAIFQGKTGSNVKESFEVTLYFTRAQAIALAELFDQEFLVKLVEEKKKETLYSDGDEYVENGEAAENGEAYTESGSATEPDYVEAE